jgi:hypothetical protein
MSEASLNVPLHRVKYLNGGGRPLDSTYEPKGILNAYLYLGRMDSKG